LNVLITMMWTAEPTAAVPPDDVPEDDVELADVAEPPDDELLQAEATAARKASAAADATTRGAGPLRLPWVADLLPISTLRPLRRGARTSVCLPVRAQ
jgi:hypothetical protein